MNPQMSTGQYHPVQGEETILEVNGTSSGLGPEPMCTEDNVHIRDLVMEKLAELCPRQL